MIPVLGRTLYHAVDGSPDIIFNGDDRGETRTLLIASGLVFSIWYFVLVVYHEQLQWVDVVTAVSMGGLILWVPGWVLRCLSMRLSGVIGVMRWGC